MVINSELTIKLMLPNAQFKTLMYCSQSLHIIYTDATVSELYTVSTW